MHVLLLLACLSAVGNAYNAKVPVQVLPERFDTFPGRNPSLTRPAVVGVQTLPGRVPPQTLPGVVGVSPLVSPGRPGITGSIRPFQRPGQYSFTRCYGNPCPGICTLEYAPVCGTDGVTYPNKCFLLDTKRCDKPYLEVDYPGSCRPY
uniref:Kazal-type proteinase inhibitor n=1 Tax=Portunus trituberculatus TaxID=210409 RepID=H8Y6I7_PORTR|nr:kazal-type proteinase inhibitor [Portunus trituberculatus]AFI56573.1 Kazal-type serine proteinase inhibitor [Portunus trituberculatus]